MAIFTREEYVEEKKNYILGCEHANYPTQAQLDTLRLYGGEEAAGDVDLAILSVDARTKHFTRLTSKRKAKKMLEGFKNFDCAQKSAYAERSIQAIAEYLCKCGARDKRRRIAFASFGVLTAFLLCGGLFLLLGIHGKKNTVYTLYYQANGGSLERFQEEFTAQDELILAKPVREAYLFEGWFTSDSYQEEVAAIQVGTTEDVTVYAKWTPIVYHIDYDLAGGENSAGNPAFYTAECDVKLTQPHRRGYDFQGWLDSSTKQERSELSAAQDGDVSLVATWSPKEYCITVYPDNGQPAVRQTVAYDACYCLDLPASSAGYSLETLTYEGKPIAASGIFTYDCDISLLAHYIPNDYTVRYVVLEGSVHTQTVTFGEAFSLYTPEEREGFEFDGWYRAPVGGERETGGVYECTSDLTLYASWKKVLTIHLESGTEYTVDRTIEKAYVVGDYKGAFDNPMTDICITIAARDTDFTLALINVGFRAKEGRTAIQCENSSFTLTVLLTGENFVEGGRGSNGSSGVGGSAMRPSNCDGGLGGDGGAALDCGRVVFESGLKGSSLTLCGGGGGDGGGGGCQGSRKRAFLNYLPCGGDGGDSGAALCCVSYSINGTHVVFQKGDAGRGGEAGYRGSWAKAKNYGDQGEDGSQTKEVVCKEA